LVDKLCDYLTKRIRHKMPEVDDERAEVINYGLHLVLGEVPKAFALLAIAYIAGVIKLTIITLLVILPYKACSGGVHLKTHIGCIIATSIAYVGTAYISKIIVFPELYIKYLFALVIWIFSMVMVFLYAPADTENVPILRKKERKIKKILSYITMSVTITAGIVIKDPIISNILIFGVLIQTISITRFIYKITNNKYGYEKYCEDNEAENLT